PAGRPVGVERRRVAAGRWAEVGVGGPARAPGGVGRAQIRVGYLDRPRDRLAVVEVRDVLTGRLVEQEAARRPSDRVEDLPRAPLRVIGLDPVALDVVRYTRGGRPQVAVDGGLGVGAHAVEQREALHQRVDVRGDLLA